MVYATRAIGFLGLLAFATSLLTPIPLKITFPGAGDTVCIGSGLDATWIGQDTDLPSMGTLYYVQDGVPDTDHPAASNFPLSDGHVKFIVQNRKIPGTYQLAMAGYSGSWSQPFILRHC